MDKQQTNDKRERVGFRLTVEAIRALDGVARDLGLTRTGAVEVAVREYVRARNAARRAGA